MNTLRIFLYPLIWALFIAFLCGIPGKDLPHVSWLELLSFDKLVHAGVFFVQYWLLYRAFITKQNTHHPILITLLSCMMYGGFLEIMQQLVFIDRSADLFDFIANSFGSFLAIIPSKKSFRGIDAK